MKYSLFIDGRRTRKGTARPNLETIKAPEGATLRTHDGTRPRWYWRTLDRWHEMDRTAQGSPAEILAKMQTP